MKSVFAFVRHGYRSTSTTTPQTILHVSPLWQPQEVQQPSFGGAFAQNLLNGTLSRTLPSVISLVAKSNDTKNPPVVAETSTSRCQQTAVAWAHYLGSSSIMAVPAAPDHPVDPRVHHLPAQAGLDDAQWNAAQMVAADRYRQEAQCRWAKLLHLLGFTLCGTDQKHKENSPPTPPGGKSMGSVSPSAELARPRLEVKINDPVDGRQRALQYLNLPSSTFDFASTVIMSFGLCGTTSFDVWRSSHWPKPRTQNGRKIFRAASKVLAIVLAVWYPQGYVANAMSIAMTRLMTSSLEKARLSVACSHEELMHVAHTAFGLGDRFYPVPASAIVLRQKKQQLRMYVVQNKISRSGKIKRSAKCRCVGKISTHLLQELASQPTNIAIPELVCDSVEGSGRVC